MLSLLSKMSFLKGAHFLCGWSLCQYVFLYGSVTHNTYIIHEAITEE